MTEPVWWVTASSPKLSQLVKINRRMEKQLDGKSQPVSTHLSQSGLAEPSVCRLEAATAHTPSEAFHLLHNGLKTLPLYVYD